MCVCDGGRGGGGGVGGGGGRKGGGRKGVGGRRLNMFCLRETSLLI